MRSSTRRFPRGSGSAARSPFGAAFAALLTGADHAAARGGNPVAVAFKHARPDGRIAYDAEALGIDVDDRRRALSAYIDAFVSFEP